MVTSLFSPTSRPGDITLSDSRNHIWHLKAEWAKSGDMVDPVKTDHAAQKTGKQKTAQRAGTAGGQKKNDSGSAGGSALASSVGAGDQGSYDHGSTAAAPDDPYAAHFSDTAFEPPPQMPQYNSGSSHSSAQNVADLTVTSAPPRVSNPNRGISGAGSATSSSAGAPSSGASTGARAGPPAAGGAPPNLTTGEQDRDSNVLELSRSSGSSSLHTNGREGGGPPALSTNGREGSRVPGETPNSEATRAAQQLILSQQISQISENPALPDHIRRLLADHQKSAGSTPTAGDGPPGGLLGPGGEQSL